MGNSIGYWWWCIVKRELRSAIMKSTNLTKIQNNLITQTLTRPVCMATMLAGRRKCLKIQCTITEKSYDFSNKHFTPNLAPLSRDICTESWRIRWKSDLNVKSDLVLTIMAFILGIQTVMCIFHNENKFGITAIEARTFWTPLVYLFIYLYSTIQMFFL